MSEKFTPGPWYSMNAANDYQHIIASEGDGATIAVTYTANVADAALIAVAPEMFAALAIVADIVTSGKDAIRAYADIANTGTWELIQAALSKARGE